ncbi:MAG: hypothetical protein ACNI26_08430 [Terasakiella sp.]|uniref:hypothetical protein n=1 Tax=unclassified Terasakiella TaxID=2614952 RepID=UPI003B009663
MINLKTSISAIEELLQKNTNASLTYAALECRLAIERICYERLRLNHDYISHDDLKKWQPQDIVRTLIQEVDANTAETFTLSISKEPLADTSKSPTLEEYQATEFVSIGTQIGFNPKKLGKFWNALAKLALHISLPVNKNDSVTHYGDIEKIRMKVIEVLHEIKQIDKGTLMISGIGEQVSFECICKSKNQRRLELLKNGQVISCINPECNETYTYNSNDKSFERRTIDVICQNCDNKTDIPKKIIERLRTEQSLRFNCEFCGEKNLLAWRLMQAKK